MNREQAGILGLWVELVAQVIVMQNERIDALETAVQTLETAVGNLEADETPLKETVEEAVTHLASLEAEVKQLQEAGTLTPEKASELAEKINNVAAAVTLATTSLKGA